MFDEDIVHGKYLRPASENASAFRFKMRLPWYRSLPLSCIERLEIKIDRDTVDQRNATLSLCGTNYALSELPSLDSVWWFVLDAVDIQVRLREPLSPGEHEVSVELELRIPYGITFEFKQVAHCSKTLTLPTGDAL